MSYIEKTTGAEQRVYAKAVVVAGSACESARLLLNSRSPSFPNGIASSSGVVGRYLTDSVGSDLAGHFPQLEKVAAELGVLGQLLRLDAHRLHRRQVDHYAAINSGTSRHVVTASADRHFKT